WPVAELTQAELDQVVLGRDHYAILRLPARPGSEIVKVAARIKVVVGIGAQRLRISSQRSKSMLEARWISNAAKRYHGPAQERFERARGPFTVLQFDRSMGCFRDWNAGNSSLYFLL